MIYEKVIKDSKMTDLDFIAILAPLWSKDVDFNTFK